MKCRMHQILMSDRFGNDDVARHWSDMGPCRNRSTDRAKPKTLRVTTFASRFRDSRRRRAPTAMARAPQKRLDIVERSFDNAQARTSPASDADRTKSQL